MCFAHQARIDNEWKFTRKLDRLARDFPDLHEAVKTGQLTVHGASIQAGFEKGVADRRVLRRCPFCVP